MISNVCCCDFNHNLIPVRSIHGIPSELGLSPKMTELHDEKSSFVLSVLTIPPEPLIIADKIEMVIEYKLYPNKHKHDKESNNDDGDDDSKSSCDLNNFTPKDKQVIFDLVKNKATEYVKFCNDELNFLKHNCNYERTQVNSANVRVDNMMIIITFEKCDLMKIVNGMHNECNSGYFGSVIDNIKLENGTYDMYAELTE